jgi:uncharacterized protein YgbK (DUF1537 family)
MIAFLKIILTVLVFASLGVLGFAVYQHEQSLQMLKRQGPILSWPQVDNLIEEKIEEKIAAVKFPAASSSAVTTVIEKVVVPSPSAAAKPQPREFIVPLGGGTVTETDKWVDIYSAQAAINSDNYSKIKAAYFEAVMHIPNAQGEARAKLVETTLPFSYDGEVLRTRSGVGEWLSVPIVLRPGSRHYRVLLFNQIGTAVLDSSRIRIVTE